MPLRATRFAGDPILEGCLKGSVKLTPGSKGPAVAKIQQALLDLGEKLPRSGANGSFGGELTAALISFQKKRNLRPPDGIVGIGTMGSWTTRLRLKAVLAPRPPDHTGGSIPRRRPTSSRKAERVS